MIKTLSKSRFKLALECNTKAYYDANRDIYANQSSTNEFLNLLAFGGNQFGELVKYWYKQKDPLAKEIVNEQEDQQIEETQLLLKKDQVTLFEATLKYKNLLLRADVLEKIGNTINLIEVKSAGWNSDKDSLLGKSSRANPINPAFESYVYDIAFQSYVANLIYPNYDIKPYLLFLDTNQMIDFDGLAQLFVCTDKEKKKVEIKDELKLKQLKKYPFALIDAGEAVKIAQNKSREKKGRDPIIFTSIIKNVSELLSQGIKPTPQITASCKSCTYYQSSSTSSSTKKSGWHECMKDVLNDNSNIERKDSIFSFYKQVNYQELLTHKVLAMKSLPLINTQLSKHNLGKISTRLRQDLQLLESKNQIKEIFFDPEAVGKIYNSWKFPLHFIDFETSRSPLPYFRNQHPHQQILFQFSHHVMHNDGKIEHKTEKLIAEPNINPSLRVLTELEKALKNDQGTVFHWYPHERNVLKDILNEANQEKIENLKNITLFLESLGINKEPNTRLFDLGTFFDQYIFIPGTLGSSSMKKLLPAILKHSSFLKEKYQKPIYGSDTMQSHNFKNKSWYVEEDGLPKNPYELLGDRFNDSWINNNLKQAEALEGEVLDKGVTDGAAAMIAFSKLQEKDLDTEERNNLQKQLKKYCELDTLAMVMAYEAVKSNII